jgi:multisubunit Na+/H+ antiporter MnhF subunit
MSPELLSEWQSHLTMQATTAATLLGLVFVAASINLARIVSTPALPGRVLESVVQFVQVLFISMLMTIPQQSSTTLAIEVLTVSFLSWAFQMIAFARYHRARLGNPGWWLVARMALAHLAVVPFFVFGGCLLFHIVNALYWALPGFFFSLLAGLINSWVLLIRVGRGVNYSATRAALY